MQKKEDHMKLQCNLEKVGDTPLVSIHMDEFPALKLQAKLEFYNPTGSVKDRAACYIIQKLLDTGDIDRDTTLIESSSGNFGIALAAYCKKRGQKFIAVVDPHITTLNEVLIRSFDARIIKVDQPDDFGGYLLTRVKTVKELCKQIDNSYWVNQYGNPYNAEAYYHTLGAEICGQMDNIDYVFMGVSSGGTITGVSRKIKERFPNAKVIAVDIYGSVIFGNPPKKRFIPGIGSSMRPDILNMAKIDDVVMMDEVSTIENCLALLKKHYIFAGGSSGSVFGAIKKYFANRKITKKLDIVAVFADRGERYANTVYDKEWAQQFIAHHSN
jgi:cysteine synthase A